MLTVENLIAGPGHPARLLRDAARRLRRHDPAFPPATVAALAEWLDSQAAAAEKPLSYDSPEGPCCAEPAACGGHPATWECGDCCEPLGECPHGFARALAVAAAVVTEVPVAAPAGIG